MFDIHLITGGTGFIGSNCVHRLVREGKTVRVFDNLSSGNLDNLQDIRKDIEFIEGDLRNTDAVYRAMKGVRHVYHFAATASVQASIDDPFATHDINLTGTLNAMIAARDTGVDRFILASSASVYGNSPEMPKREDMMPEPLTAYAISKLSGEYYGRVFHELYGLQFYALRYFNVFGPRQNPKSHYASVIPLFMKAYLTGQQPVIYGDGDQTRDFTFVEDIIDANFKCLSAPSNAAGNPYNVAYGSRISINALAAAIAKMAGMPFNPEYRPARQGDIRESQADASLARRFLRWEPHYSFEEGLQKTFDWYQAHLA